MDDLRAAIPLADSSNILSTQEFQKMLSVWLEEKGVLSELRSQLRYKMINALKDTAIGRDVSKRHLHRMSLSKQAVNLIVAEYLMQNKCHYSLSIFNAEASLTYIFPEYPIIFNNLKTVNETYRLDKENILNILELIGIAKTSTHYQELFASYFSDQENNSLLSCLISLLCKLANKDDTKQSNSNLDADFIDLDNEANFIKQIANILMWSNVPVNNVQIAIENIKILYEVERKSIEEAYSRLTSELKIEVGNQKNQIREVLKTNKALENQLLKTNKDYRKLKSHTKNLIIRERLLKENYKRLMDTKGFSKTVNNNLKEYNSSEIVNNENVKVCHLQHCNAVCIENTRLNEELSKENQNLRKENEQQKEKIKKLTLKCTGLISEFTECQTKINLLNCRINEGNPAELLASFLYEENVAIPVKVNLENIDVSDISSDSNTEEILHQTRLRLRQLEEETKAIEEKCKYFHMRNVV